jgi:hypothetical protein
MASSSTHAIDELIQSGALSVPMGIAVTFAAAAQ